MTLALLVDLPLEFRWLFVFVVKMVVLAFVFYVAGVLVVGGKRARFGDALVISLLGTILGDVCIAFLHGIFGLIAALVVWLVLIRYFYETGWLGAVGVAVLAVIVYVILIVVLGVIFTLVFELLPGIPFPSMISV